MDMHAHNEEVVGRTLAASDPTHTLTLRNAFVREMNRRFGMLKAQIWQAVRVDDVFGLGTQPSPLTLEVNVRRKAITGLPRRAFQFKRDPAKVEEFMRWLRVEMDKGILSTVSGGARSMVGAKNWTYVYIQSAYKKGVEQAYREAMTRGREEMAKATGRKEKALIREQMSKLGVLKDRSIEATFFSPVHADRVGLLYTRAFTELKGITDDLGKIVSHSLSESLAEGRSPYQVARILMRRVEERGFDLSIKDSKGRTISALRRARMLARTEIVRAHAEASLNTYAEAGIQGVQVVLEFSTAGDDRVCPECESILMSGGRYSIEEARGIIPVHPLCRCAWRPWSLVPGKEVAAGKVVEKVPVTPPAPAPAPVVPPPPVAPVAALPKVESGIMEGKKVREILSKLGNDLTESKNRLKQLWFAERAKLDALMAQASDKASKLLIAEAGQSLKQIESMMSAVSDPVAMRASVQKLLFPKNIPSLEVKPKLYAKFKQVVEKDKDLSGAIEKGCSFVSEWLGKPFSRSVHPILKERGESVRSLVFDSVPEKVVGRKAAHYDDLSRTVHLMQGNTAKTVVHEMGHWIQHMSKEVNDDALAFLNKRTAGGTVRKLQDLFPTKGYSSDEIAKVDAFTDPFTRKDAFYVGKQYEKSTLSTGHTQTEVISMGLQWMYQDPIAFARVDPEFFDFIHELRKHWIGVIK